MLGRQPLIRSETVSRHGLQSLALLALVWAGGMAYVESSGGASAGAARTDIASAVKPVPPEALGLAEAADGAAWSCRPDVLATSDSIRVDFLLADLVAGRTPTPASVTAAETVARRSIGCAPFEGTAWLLLAMARHLGGDKGDGVRRALEMSSFTTPNEPAGIFRRVIFADAFVTSGAKDFLPPLKDDVRRLVVSGADEAIAIAYRDGSPDLRGIIRETVAALADPVRKAAHATVFDRIDKAPPIKP
ncbi:hypothetical protein [Chthonobacter albigriseus]|uniref:hypothetical protein n=1 Tax=Chthonobacter albigriseus TaxID=1683161 RepID=UPI0015EF7C98|nr:hypothetical protein [Chthonobacter albigriseus]